MKNSSERVVKLKCMQTYQESLRRQKQGFFKKHERVSVYAMIDDCDLIDIDKMLD